MKLSRLKWIALGGVAVYVVALDAIRGRLLPYLDSPGTRLLMNAVAALGGVFLLALAFHFVEMLHKRVEARNAELLALHHAALEISGELDLETILQKVVDRARELVSTRYGALAVYDTGGRILAFLTSGLDAEVRAKIGDPPVGRGLLGVEIPAGTALRVSEIGRDPRSVGFPAHHPAMTSLLAVPITCRAPFRGNLYLADRLDGSQFGDEEEQTLVRFATQAALAVEAAHLHHQMRDFAVAEERLRLAHEMHDGQAQVLASVNATAQAIREFLRTGRIAEASAQLDRLAAASRELYAEVREGILALRAAGGAGQSGREMHEILSEYVAQWQDQANIDARVDLRSRFRLSAGNELQVLRIAQEALANVRKHSGARSVQVELTTEDGEHRLVIADNGRGFDPASPKRTETPRFGLATMRERAEAVGGRLEVESSAGAGTRVMLRLPVRRTDMLTSEEVGFDETGDR